MNVPKTSWYWGWKKKRRKDPGGRSGCLGRGASKRKEKKKKKAGEKEDGQNHKESLIAYRTRNLARKEGMNGAKKGKGQEKPTYKGAGLEKS